MSLTNGKGCKRQLHIDAHMWPDQFLHVDTPDQDACGVYAAEQSSTSAGQIAAVRAQQPAVDELLQLISRTSDTACSTTASNTGTGRLAAVGSKLFSISREPSSSSLTHMKAGQLVCYTNSTGRAGPPTAAAAAAAAARRNGLQLVGNQAGVGLSRLSS